MKKIFSLVLLALFVNPGIDAQVSFLNVLDSFNTSIPFEGIYDGFEVYSDLLYGVRGDTVYSIDLANSNILKKYGMPDEDYAGFNSFLELKPDGSEIWVGYTLGDNSDDRIYAINCESGVWDHVATMPANFDLAFYNDQPISSGLNSSDWSAPNGIWALDLTGANEHQLLIATGGYSAGLDTDANGNVYYGTSFFSDNKLLKWNESDVKGTLANPNDTLKISDATTLATLPAGAYNVDVDNAGNIAFNCNNFVLNFLAVWDGDASYDTIATTELFLTQLSTRGNILSKVRGNQILACAYGTEIVETHYDLAPVVIDPIEDISFVFDENEESEIDLNMVFNDEDDHDSVFVFSVIQNSNDALISSLIDSEMLTLQVIGENPGNAEIVIQAASHLFEISDTISLTVANPVGKENALAANAIVVYPNPSSDYVKIAASDLDGGVVSIFDIKGRVVHKQNYQNSDETINISGLMPGNYVLVLRTTKHTYNTHILKK